MHTEAGVESLMNRRQMQQPIDVGLGPGRDIVEMNSDELLRNDWNRCKERGESGNAIIETLQFGISRDGAI